MSIKLLIVVTIVGFVRAVASIVVIVLALFLLSHVGGPALSGSAMVVLIVVLTVAYAWLEHYLVTTDRERWGPVKRLASVRQP